MTRTNGGLNADEIGGVQRNDVGKRDTQKDNKERGIMIPLVYSKTLCNPPLKNKM